MKFFLLIILMIFISPLHSLSQDEKQVSVTQEQIENIYNFIDGNFLAFIQPYIIGEMKNEIAGTLFGPTPGCNRKRKERGKEQTHPKRISIARDGEPIKQFSINDFDETVTRQERSRYKNNSEINEF